MLRQKLGVRRRRQLPIAYRSLTGDDPLAQDLVGGGASTLRVGELTAARPRSHGSRARLFNGAEARYASSSGLRHPSLTMDEGSPAREPPIGRQRIVARPRLLRSSNDSVARIRIVVAPAGYGKTTLARQWLEDTPSGWCICHPGYADVAALAVGLQSAAGLVVAGSGGALLERLPVTRQADEEVDDLAGCWPRIWLVGRLDRGLSLMTTKRLLVRGRRSVSSKCSCSRPQSTC